MFRYLTRIPGIRRLWSKFPLGSVALRTEYDIWERPAYAYGIYSAARLAQSLEIKNFSVIEFGVAGGNGLLVLQHLAERISNAFGMNITVFGFDTGSGMPKPLDYRDLPHVYQKGFYKMDIEKLKPRLKTAQLIIGDIFDTIPGFFAQSDLPPVGFVAFDLDYYSSTKKAFGIFEGIPSTRLPRVFCYFDDIIYPERACHNEYLGELCAIREFNENSHLKKICKMPNLAWMRRHPAIWNEQIYVFHDFEHPLYSRLITPTGEAHRQLKMKGQHVLC